MRVQLLRRNDIETKRLHAYCTPCSTAWLQSGEMDSMYVQLLLFMGCINHVALFAQDAGQYSPCFFSFIKQRPSQDNGCLSGTHWRTWRCLACVRGLRIGIHVSFARLCWNVPTIEAVGGIHYTPSVSLSYLRIGCRNNKGSYRNIDTYPLT